MRRIELKEITVQRKDLGMVGEIYFSKIDTYTRRNTSGIGRENARNSSPEMLSPLLVFLYS